MLVKMSEWTEPVSMEVMPWYTGREVKAVMESATGMFLDGYVVSHGGKIIQDSASFYKCNMNKEMPIYLLSSGKKFQIVARGCGWEELIVVCESYTVRDVKKMVENFAQVKPERQVLFRGGDDSVGLDDDEKSLAFYDVVEKSTIWVLGLALKLTIKMPQAGDVVTVSAYKIDTVKHIKAHICEKMGIPCSSQKLFYKGTFLADEADLLEAYSMEGVNCVIFATFGSGDDDEQVKDLEKIKLTFKGDSISHLLELEVECSTCEESESESDGEESEGELFKLKLKSSNTMLDVKTVIQSEQSFPVCSQQLYSDETLLKDWRNLWDYNITKWLFISSPLMMFIETPNHKKVVIKASNTNRVREILDMIPKEALDNISWKPSLFLDGNVIPEHKTLAQCGVQSGSVLWLDRLVQIDVSGPNGATTHVNVNLSYTIKAVKEKIERECGIPIGLQRLIYGGDELNDDMTIGQYEKVLGSLWALRWNFCRSSWSFFYPSYQFNKI